LHAFIAFVQVVHGERNKTNERDDAYSVEERNKSVHDKNSACKNTKKVGNKETAKRLNS